MGGGKKVEERRVSAEERRRVVLKPKQRMSEGARKPVRNVRNFKSCVCMYM